MKAADVFTPQRLPTVTLVTKHLTTMREQYRHAMEERGKLVRVIGPSKSGKTVFIKNTVGIGNLVPITGAGVVTTDDLWTRVLDAIGSNVGKTEEQSNSQSSGQSVGAEISGNVLVAKGTVEGGFTREKVSESTSTQTKAVDLLQSVIRDLAGSGLTVFIDDFHYVPPQVQTDLAQQIKQAVENGVLIAAAAVPFRSEDVLRANDDLQGRIADFRFDYWSEDDLVSIAKLGFVELNIGCSDEFALALAKEAAGSPQLMQSLCLETCREMGVNETQPKPVDIPEGNEFIARVCERVSSAVDFTSTIDRMRSGPLTRGSQRKSYVLNDGSTADVYPIIVQAMKLDPPTLHFRYADLQARIAAICAKDSPHFADACFHIAKIVNANSNFDKLDWDTEQHLLSVRDPYLLFAIRWT